VNADLKRVEAFMKKEAELEGELEEKSRRLEMESKEHATSISDLERKHVQEKDRLKKEMLHKLRETKANLLKLTDNQLDTTTKRTIAENEQMSSELAWQSKETEKLIRKNDKLMSENSGLKRELSLHQQTQEEFAKKVNVYQKTIKTLLAKINDMDASQQAELQRIHLDDDERERERAEDLREREELDENLAHAGDRLRTAHEEIERLQHKLHDVESKYASVLSLQDEAVKFTLQCLADMRDRPGAVSGVGAARFAELTDDDRDGSHTFTLQSLDPTRREDVMSYILEQLRAYQEQLKELELHSAWRQHTASAHENANSFNGISPVSLPRIPPNAAASSNGLWGGPPGQVPILGDVLPPGVDIGAGEGTTVLAVNAPLRPWGKRSKEGIAFKPTRHAAPEGYLRR